VHLESVAGFNQHMLPDWFFATLAPTGIEGLGKGSMKNLTVEQKSFIWSGAFLALGLFVAMYWFYEEIRTPILTVSLLFMCLVGGTVFAGVMYVLSILSGRFAGRRNIQSKDRTKKERLTSFISTCCAVMPIAIVLLTDQGLLWPMLASSVAPLVMMNPLVYQKPDNTKLFVRTMASIVGAFFIFMFVFIYLISDRAFEITPLVMLVAACSSVLWCLSYFLSIHANRSNS